MDEEISTMEIDGHLYQNSVRIETLWEKLKSYLSNNISLIDPAVALKFMRDLEAMYQNDSLFLVDTEESQKSFRLLFAEIASLKEKVTARENEVDEFWEKVCCFGFDFDHLAFLILSRIHTWVGNNQVR